MIEVDKAEHHRLCKENCKRKPFPNGDSGLDYATVNVGWDSIDERFYMTLKPFRTAREYKYDLIRNCEDACVGRCVPTQAAIKAAWEIMGTTVTVWRLNETYYID